MVGMTHLPAMTQKRLLFDEVFLASCPMSALFEDVSPEIKIKSSTSSARRYPRPPSPHARPKNMPVT